MIATKVADLAGPSISTYEKVDPVLPEFATSSGKGLLADIRGMIVYPFHRRSGSAESASGRRARSTAGPG